MKTSTDPVRDAEIAMAGAIEAMVRSFDGIRTGRASSTLVDHLRVFDHGRTLRLDAVAVISVPSPDLIVIRPWEPSLLRSIGQAIRASDVDLTPTIDGPVIRLEIPRMTEERRLELVGRVHRQMEVARVEVRGARQLARDHIRQVGADHRGVDERVRRLAAIDAAARRADDEIERLGRLKADDLLRA